MIMRKQEILIVLQLNQMKWPERESRLCWWKGNIVEGFQTRAYMQWPEQNRGRKSTGLTKIRRT